MVFGVVVVAACAVLTIRRGAIDFLFLEFRRDERPMEFWLALLAMTAGAVGVLYGVLA